MKALVIGGGGFVGPYLVRHLTDDCGYEVTVTKTKNSLLWIMQLLRILIFLTLDR